MKTNVDNSILFAKQRPMLIGVCSMLAVIVLGVGLAFATGLTNPQATHADDGFDIGSDPTDVGGIGGIGDPGSFDPGNITDPTNIGGTDITNPTDTGGTDVTDQGPTDLGNGYTPSPNDANVGTDPVDIGIGTNDGTTDVGTAPDTSTTESPTDQDTNLQPCCTNDYNTDVGTAPDTSTYETPTDQDTNLAPCCTDTTPTTIDVPTPVETPPVIVTPPVVPPVIVVPPSHPPVNPPPVIPPPHVCPVGDTGTFPNCVPPVNPPPVNPPPVNPPPVNPPPVNPPPVNPPPVNPPPGGGCTGDCGGTIVYGGGGGGGFGVSGQLIAAPTAAYVTLSQIPYTGLDLGPVGTVVYWVALIVFCASATYLTIFKIVPFVYRRLNMFGLNVGAVLNSTPVAAGAAHGVAAAHGASHAAPTHAPAPQAPQAQAHEPAAPIQKPVAAAFLQDEGFRSFARDGVLTIDDIVKGLARETGAATMAAVAVQPEPAHHVEAPATVVNQATFAEVAQPVARPQAQAPVRQAAPAVTISTDVRDFIRALLNADRDTVFATIRQIVREGGDAEMFITQVVCALDDAYRARVEGTKVNAEIAQMTEMCGTQFLERLTTALTNAVDSSYSPGISGTKLALTRALAVVEG